jgi:hypothetical protein
MEIAQAEILREQGARAIVEALRAVDRGEPYQAVLIEFTNETEQDN